jgi:ParB family chromosome partitioning protein
VAFAEVNSTAHVGQSTGQPEWYTPDDFLDAARDVMGGIDLDPASSEIAQQRVQAETFYTAANSGLDKPGQGRLWLVARYTEAVWFPPLFRSRSVRQ